MNALLGTANLVLREVEEHSPRAVVLCFGPDAADYRVELYDGYHAERPRCRTRCAPVRRRARRSSRRSAGRWPWSDIARGRRPARHVRPARGRGGRHGARDDRRPGHVPVRDRPGDGAVRAHRRPGRRAGGPRRGAKRYGVSPSRCPTSSPCAATRRTGSPARRGSARRPRPSCSAPRLARGGAGRGDARDAAERAHGAARAARRAARFKDIATLRDAGVKPPAGRADRLRGGRRGGPRARHQPAGRAAGRAAPRRPPTPAAPPPPGSRPSARPGGRSTRARAGQPAREQLGGRLDLLGRDARPAGSR